MLATTADPRLATLPEVLEQTAPEVSVRLNPHKRYPEHSPSCSEDSLICADGKVAWWDGGIYISHRPKFTFDPALHQGAYYVQDASSMILAAIAAKLSAHIANNFTPRPASPLPLLWLDACAAPGGKTTAAIDALPEGSLVVANEYDFQRAEILKENVAKWGSPNVVVSRGDTSRFRKLPELFDVVAVDAPCSGEGMMRKDAMARQQWTPRLVAECADRQREILRNLWETVRPGGFLIYSTCTFNTTENEEIVLWLIDTYGAVPVDLSITAEGIDGPVALPSAPRAASLPAMRFIPGRAKGEGLFVCVLRKPEETNPAFLSLRSNNITKKKNKGNDAKKGEDSFDTSKLLDWLSEDYKDRYTIIKTAEEICAFPAEWLSLLPRLEKNLTLISAGVELARIKGHDLIPSHGLALSTILNRDAFVEVEVDKPTALQYLAREAIALPQDTPKGFVLLTYNSLPLGFVKNIGNRSNNLYPKEWRIKSLSV